jgi:signal transduction histidine kinase
MIAAAPPAPTGTLEILRELHDGASYRLVATAPGTTTIALCDPEHDVACIALDRAGARRFIEDLELVAGLRPTAPALGLAAALAGSVRVVFERLAELEKTDPTGADRIYAAITAHVRSSRPLALTEECP